MSEEIEVRRTTFGMVPDWVDEAITDGHEMRVYVRLVRKYANARTRECYPSQQTLAEELGIGLRTVQRAIAGLIEHGALIVASRQRRPDGSLGRNRYWLPMDQPRKPAGQVQPPRQAHGPAAPPGGQPAAPPGGSTNQTHRELNPTTSAAAAPELPLDLPKPEERQEEIKPPTLNQRAVKLAQAHYDRLGGVGNVPAWVKIIRKELEHGHPDDLVDRACAWIGQHNWTLTGERLRNTLQGGPRRPSSPPPTTTRNQARTGPDGRGPILEFN